MAAGGDRSILEGNSASSSVDFELGPVDDHDVTLKLRSKFEEGLQSTSGPYYRQIKEVAEELHISVDRVKNFIGNERNRRKRKYSKDHSEAATPPQKIRLLNGYNIFTRHFFKSEAGKAIHDISDRNKACAESWRELTIDEQKMYDEKAKHEYSECVPNSWKETKRILENMKSNCCWGEKIHKVDICYMVVHDNETYVGGTTLGQDWLMSNPSVPLSFLSHVSKSLSNNAKDLKKEVEMMLRHKYSLTTGVPTNKVPYASLTNRNVHLNGQEFTLQSPSSMSVSELLYIKNNIQKISFVDVPPTEKGPADHTYCANMTSSEQAQSGTSKGSIGSSLLSVVTENETPLVFSSPSVNFQHNIGSTVNLLINGKSVGIATVMEGETIHGRPLPFGYTKISILEIEDNMKPLFETPFDDNYLCKNSISAWPSNQICLSQNK